MAADKKTPARMGPKPITFDQGQLDAAKRTIGRVQWPSKAAGRLARKYGFNLEVAYRLLDQAREQVVRDLAASGTANDPLTGIVVFLQGVVGDTKADLGHRLTASGQVVKLLGLDRLLKQMDAAGVEDFLNQVAARRAARAGAGSQPPAPLAPDSEAQ